MMKNTVVALVVGVASYCVAASPLSVPVKAAVEGVERVGAKIGLRAGGGAAIRGGATLATVTAERAAVRSVAVSAAKEVTAKKILAAGGATAAVVGTHEISDGIQSMGAGVGQAVKDNPNIAGDVAETIVAPARWIVIVVSVGLLLVVSWIIWPWFTLIRNWGKWRAAKAMKKYALEPKPVAGERSACSCLGNSGKINVQMVFALGALSVLTTIGLLRMSWNKGGGRMEKHQDQAVEIGLRKEAISRLRNEYERSVEKLYEDFRHDVGATSEMEFGKVRDGIPGVVDKYGTMSRCASLVKTIAIDKWKGGTRTEQSIREDLEANYYRGLYSARDNVIACVERFRRGLELSRVAFASGVAKELGRGDIPGDEAYAEALIECGDRIEKAKLALADGQRNAGIAVLIETVCIRQTVATVAKILGKAAARQAATMTAGAGACVADGPLPIGDCIAVVGVVGCTAWTGWDVYKATKILPKELADTLRATTEECAQKCCTEVYGIGGEMYRRYVKLAREA